MPSVIYWKNILVPSTERGIPPLLHGVLSKLLNGEYKSAGLRRIGDIYRVKINRSQRLCFSSHRDPISGVRFLVLREVFEDHDQYQRAINDAVVQQRYRDWNEQAPPSEGFRQIELAELSAHVAPCQVEETIDEAGALEVVVFPTASEVVELSLEQQRVLNTLHLSFPTILHGEAGTGKTMLFMATLEQLLENREDLGPGSILYLADAPSLLEQTRLFFEERICPSARRNIVTFKTYKQLVEARYPGTSIVPEAYFSQFLNKKRRSASSNFLNEHPTAYWLSEFRLISGCANLEEYNTLGQKLSLVSKSATSKEDLLRIQQLKASLWSLYESYCAQLAPDQLDLVYSRLPETTARYEIVMVDEAHVLSAGQLRNLKRMATNNNCLFCMHEAQRIKDTRFSHLLYLQYLYPNISSYELTRMFRCPPEVLTFIDAFITQAKIQFNPRSPEHADAPQRSSLHKTTVQVALLPDSIEPQLMALAQRHDFAIICHPSLVASLQGQYKTGNVFSVEEVIGLQFPHVCVYNLVPEQDFIAMSRQLEAVAGQSKHQRKTDTARDAYEAILNQFYVACTRVLRAPETSLYFYQKGLHQDKTPLLFEAIRPFLEPAKTVHVIPSDTQAWIDQVDFLEEQGLSKQAAAIRSLHDIQQEPTPPITPVTITVPTTLPQRGISSSKTLDYMNGFLKEGYLQAVNSNNLLEHKSAFKYLFEYLMPDSRTLFDALLQEEILGLVVCTLTETNLKTYNTLLQQALEKKFIQESIELKQHRYLSTLKKDSLGTILSQLQHFSIERPNERDRWSKEALLFQLLISKKDRHLFIQYFPLFTSLLSLKQNKMLLNQHTFLKGSDKGKNFWYCLLSIPVVTKLSFEYWQYFLQLQPLSTQVMHQVVTGEGQDKGKTPVYALLSSAKSCQFIQAHWQSFVLLDLFRKDTMHRVVTGDGPDQGTTPLHYLLSSPEGYQLIHAHWQDFVRIDLFSKDAMHQAITGGGPEQGKTPLHFLLGSLEGCQLVKAHWKYFLDLDLFSKDAMHQAITGDGPEHGKTPLLCLLSWPEGCQLIQANWQYFLDLDLFSKDAMHRVLTREGPDQGMTALHCLLSSPEGCQLVQANWQYFLNLDLFSKDAMHRAVTGDASDRGKTPLHYLLNSPEGRQLIREHEQYFVDSDLLSEELLHQAVSGACPEQDRPPIEGLLGSPTGFFCKKLVHHEGTLEKPIVNSV